MVEKQLYRAAANGEGDVFTRVWLPDTQKIVGIVQIAHGMAEHSGRYGRFAAALTEQGYAVYANDHAGHGKSMMGHKGTFSLKGDGFVCVRKDMDTLFDLMKSQYPGIPTVLFGHSMGSILSALYASEYPEKVDKLILCGTPAKNPAGDAAIVIGNVYSQVFGSTSRAKLLVKVNKSMFMKGYKNCKTSHDWISRDEYEVQRFAEDPDCGFAFSAGAYAQMLNGHRQWNSPRWASKIKQMPILIIAGDDDNAGYKGKGPKHYYEQLLAAGQKDVTLKLYEGARHELLNELNRDEVTEDILNWLLSKIT